MIRKSLFIAPLAVACLLASQAVYASPVNVLTPVNAMFARSKTIKFELHNASASPMDLKAGDTMMTLKAGETISVNLAPGTRIVTNSANSNHPAGTLVLEVSAAFNGSTITLR
ncbi:hypothetical protein P8936_17015 [Edaphobacter paludis]|uniref:Copper-binding protein n=1 Tax=Edaphobacter paludis TaxID=3035702 RepID=A0AAU7CZ49_9BACT